MGKTRAEIQAAYRQRKRQQIGDAAFLRAERERQNKYYVRVETLPKKKAEERRVQVRSRVQKHRVRVKKVRQDMDNERHQENIDYAVMDSDTTRDSALSDVSYTAPRSPLKVKLAFPVKKRRKRVSRCLINAHRRIEALTLKLQEAAKEKRRVQRRYQRLREKLPTSSTPFHGVSRNTPRSKTNTQLKKSGLDPKSVPAEIKKRLLFSNAVIQEIQSTAGSSTKQSNRANLHKLVAGAKVLKKYRLLRMVQKGTGLGRHNLSKANTNNASQRKQLRRSWSMLHEEVVTFLEREDNSRMCPGKKDCCKTDDMGNKKQKKFLCDYISNLYTKYIAENPDKRTVSLSAFQRVRQTRCPHIKPVQFSSRNLCLCPRHQNMALKLKAMKSLGLPVVENPDEFIRRHTDDEVDDLLSSLQPDVIQFEEWARVESDGRKKTKLINVSLAKQEFIARLKTSIQEFRQHVFRIKKQFEALSDCKKNLPKGECVVLMDFSENYTCVPLEEVQSGYWNQEGVTIHPLVVYFRDEDDNLSHQSYVAVSDEKGHNSSTVIAILNQVIPRLKKLVPQLSKIHYWTDGPTSQYRNKTIFSLIGDHVEVYDGIHAQWNFFEAGHGKGPCDGIGGTVKRMADNAVKRNAVIQDANDFFAWASQEHGCENDSKIDFFFVSKEECVSSSELIAQRWASVKTFPGTLQVHGVIGYDKGVLLKDVSCYCAKCRVMNPADTNQVEQMCEGWQLRRFVRGATKQVQPEKCDDPESDGVGEPTDVVKETFNQPSTSTPVPYHTDDWVAAVYEQRWYLGKVLESDEDDVHVDFLTECTGPRLQNKYKWPTRSDSIWVPRENVLCSVNPPKRDSISKRLFVLSDNQRAMVEQAFKAFSSRS